MADIEKLRVEASDAQVRFYGVLVELGLDNEVECDPRTKLSVPIVDVRAIIRHGNRCQQALDALQAENRKLREALLKLRRRQDNLETYDRVVDEIVTAALADGGEG